MFQFLHNTFPLAEDRFSYISYFPCSTSSNTMMKVINTYPISAVHEYINCPEDWKVFTWISVHGLSVQCVFLMADHPLKEPIKQSVFFSQVRYWGLPMVLFRWNSLFSNGAQLQFLLSVSLSLSMCLYSWSSSSWSSSMASI